jgi:hypothetical protein
MRLAEHVARIRRRDLHTGFGWGESEEKSRTERVGSGLGEKSFRAPQRGGTGKMKSEEITQSRARWPLAASVVNTYLHLY